MALDAKVSAAQEYLKFAERLRHSSSTFDGVREDGRELDRVEQQVYDAALCVLLRYFKTVDTNQSEGDSVKGIGGDSHTKERCPK